MNGFLKNSDWTRGTGSCSLVGPTIKKGRRNAGRFYLKFQREKNVFVFFKFKRCERLPHVSLHRSRFPWHLPSCLIKRETLVKRCTQWGGPNWWLRLIGTGQDWVVSISSPRARQMVVVSSLTSLLAWLLLQLRACCVSPCAGMDDSEPGREVDCLLIRIEKNTCNIAPICLTSLFYSCSRTSRCSRLPSSRIHFKDSSLTPPSNTRRERRKTVSGLETSVPRHRCRPVHESVMTLIDRASSSC